MLLIVQGICVTYMKEEKLDKILVIGHTKGIGKAVYDYYNKKGHTVKGLSRSNGFNLCDPKKFYRHIFAYDWIILNAFYYDSQYKLLKHIVDKYENKKKKIIVITSTSGTDICFDKTIEADSYKEYSRHKRKLIKYIEKIQQRLVDKPLQIFDVCPDIVDTQMSKGLWVNAKKLKPIEVSKAVQFCLESKFNVNRIVIQKKC